MRSNQRKSFLLNNIRVLLFLMTPSFDINASSQFQIEYKGLHFKTNNMAQRPNELDVFSQRVHRVYGTNIITRNTITEE